MNVFAEQQNMHENVEKHTKTGVFRVLSVLPCVGVVLILVPMLVRMMTIEVVVPYWDLSPLVADQPETGLLPSMAFALDGAVWLGVLLIVLCAQRVRWRTGLLLLAGVIAIVLHGVVLSPYGAAESVKGSFAGLRLGSAWAAALGGAWGLSHLLVLRAGVARTLWVASVAGVMGMAAVPVARGIYDYTEGHAQTKQSYLQDREGTLRTLGIEPGSIQADIYQRRLLQREATGWFGLSNIYATLAGAGVVGLGLMAVFARAGPVSSGVDRRDEHEKKLFLQARIVIGLGALTCAAGLYMSGSKGGVAAAGLGLALAVGVWLIATRFREPSQHLPASPPPAAEGGRATRLVSPKVALGFVGVFAIALPLLALVARGFVGERIGELSLLFRWQYIVAAVRMVGEQPVFGVGPEGFQDAYLIHKVPTNPEDVASPHSVLFDWCATLGLGGLALCALLVVWAWRAGQSVICSAQGARSTAGQADGGTRRLDEEVDAFDVDLARRLGIAAVLMGAVLAILRQSAAVNAPLLITMVFGLLGAMALVWAVAELARAPMAAVRLGLAGAALMVIAHAQIEMTPVRAQSAAWAIAVIGLAAGGLRQARALKHPHPSPLAGQHLQGEGARDDGVNVPAQRDWAGALRQIVWDLVSVLFRRWYVVLGAGVMMGLSVVQVKDSVEGERFQRDAAKLARESALVRDVYSRYRAAELGLTSQWPRREEILQALDDIVHFYADGRTAQPNFHPWNIPRNKQAFLNEVDVYLGHFNMLRMGSSLRFAGDRGRRYAHDEEGMRVERINTYDAASRRAGLRVYVRILDTIDFSRFNAHWSRGVAPRMMQNELSSEIVMQAMGDAEQLNTSDAWALSGAIAAEMFERGYSDFYFEQLRPEEAGYDVKAELAYRKAIERSPYSVQSPAALAEFLVRLPGRDADAAEMAALALKNNDLRYLDPLAQLGVKRRARLERIAAGE